MSVHFTAPKVKVEKVDYNDFSEWLNSKKYKELTNFNIQNTEKTIITND